MFTLFILFFIIDLILFEFISFFFPIFISETEIYSLLFVLVHGICVLFILIAKGNQYKHIFIIGFILRLFLMFADLYHWFPILHSGSDSETFHKLSVYNQLNIEKVFLTNYSRFLTILYSFTHCSRMIAQYVNVLMGISIVVVLRNILEKLEIHETTKIQVLWLITLFPNLLIFSGILLREAWIEFFIIFSVYYFVNWFLEGNIKDIIISIICILGASYMHDGTLVIVIGYIIAFLTYNPYTKKITFSNETIISLIILGIGCIGFMNYSSIFAERFQGVDSTDRITEMLNNKSVGGGSAYLTWVESSSFGMSLLFAPLKMFYFLYSPIPLNWRGPGDILAFIIDSSIYIYLTCTIIKTKFTDNTMSKLKKYMLIGLIIDIFIFAFGTYTAGTAMRHRAKIFSVILVIYAICIDNKKNINAHS